LNRAKPGELIVRFEKMPLYQEALRIARTVIQTPAELPGLAAGADHFERIGAPIPHWARGREPVAVVGGHQFWLLSKRSLSTRSGRPKQMASNQPSADDGQAFSSRWAEPRSPEKLPLVTSSAQ
jgi:hypothetical protein